MATTVTNAVHSVRDKISSAMPSSNQLILVTGASGFIGAHVLNKFLSRGYSVRCAVRSEASAAKIRETHSKYVVDLTFSIVPDITAPRAFNDAVKGVDGVIHIASPVTMEVENIERDLLIPAINGTTGILTSIKAFAPQVQRVVITSSFAAIIDLNNTDTNKIYTESDWNPVTYDEAKNSGNGGLGYAASKTLSEKAAYAFVEKEKPNFSIATVCPPIVYGPMEHGASISHLNHSSADLYRFMNGSTKEAGATIVACFADVRDVAEAHFKAFEHPVGGRFFITSGTFLYQDVCTIMKGLPELEAEKVTDPLSTPRNEYFKVDNSKAKKELGIQFRSLSTTITDAARDLVKLQKAAA